MANPKPYKSIKHTDKNKRDDNKESNSFFIGGFRDLSIHE